MGYIHFNNQPKYKWPVRIAFAAASLGITAAGLWYAAYNDKPEQSVTSGAGPRTYGENASGLIIETVPDQKTDIDTDSSSAANARAQSKNPKELSPQEREDKQVMINLAKDYYEEMLRETDPIRRYDRVARMRSVAVYVGEDALSALGMTEDQLEGLVKSLQVQAGPAVLENVRKMDKFDSAKIEMVVTLIEIANSLSSSDRGRYYESLGSSRAELQGYYCDGVVAAARSDMAFALSNKADEMTQNNYDYRFLSLIQSLARNMPDGYSKVCDAAGRNVYQESGISDQQIKQLLAFKPKIIPG